MDTLIAPPETQDETETVAAPGPGPAGPAEPPPGLMDFARLQVVRQIGQGGMATIHLAQLAGEGGAPPRAVALKLMHSHLNEDPSLVRRFEHEVRAQAGLVHPCVVEMCGWGRDAKGRLFMAMEYVDGPALKDLLASGRKFPADIAAYVTRCMLLGLQAAHARGLVHRDVKPANVMTTLAGGVKVADFGISKAADMTKLTSTGNVIGTPAYMSPEQALARPLDARSDLFSVGVTLYEMLVGGNPFQTGNPATTLSRVVHHQQRPAFEILPQTPAGLDELLESLMQKDPAKRVRDAAEALALLDRCIADEELCATPEAFAAYVAEPDTTTRKLNARAARRHFERGCRFYAGGRGNAEAAVWELFLATLLDPSDAQARTWLEQVSRDRGYSLHRKANPRIDELEAQLKDAPDSLPVILQLAKLHKAQGNFLQVIYYYKRAKALRPPDNYTRNQIETLVSSQAAGLLEGTGVFETKDHVPVRLKPAPAAPPAADVAEGWGDFVRGALSTGWGKMGLAATVLLGMVVVAGAVFDRAANAAAAGRSRADGAAAAEPELDRQVMALERGRSLGDEGNWAEAEKVWRHFLETYPESGLRSEVLFRLGECLERQGRRPEALEVHFDNASAHLDEWALRSRQNRGELLAVDGDTAGARREYEAVVRVADGEQKMRAQLALANLAIREGRLTEARGELEDLVSSSRETKMYDDARLSLADVLSQQGETGRARELYESVRSTADHRGDAFQRADAGLAALGGADAPAAEAVAEAAPSPGDAAAEGEAWASAPEPGAGDGSGPATGDAPPAPEPGSEAGAPAPTGLLAGLGSQGEEAAPPAP